MMGMGGTACEQSSWLADSGIRCKSCWGAGPYRHTGLIVVSAGWQKGSVTQAYSFDSPSLVLHPPLFSDFSLSVYVDELGGYGIWIYYPVQLSSGVVTNDRLLQACSARRLQTPCDHPSHSDGKCVLTHDGNRHLSYYPHWAYSRCWLTGYDNCAGGYNRYF
jgi:hypothetical protein